MSCSLPHAGPRTRPGATLSDRRIDAIEVRLRRLVDSAEPAVVFSSLVRLCVPTFSDACSVDIVEGDRVRYRISYPPSISGPLQPIAHNRVVTPFESDLAGWAPYRGVLTCSWHTRPATDADASRAALIVDHAIRTIRRERLVDPVRFGSGPGVMTGQLRAQHRSR